MALPPLPTRTSDTWEISPAFGEPYPIYAVSAHGGRVVAGGKDFFLLKAGDQAFKTRQRPADVEQVALAAQEPRAPFRYAYASAGGIWIFFRRNGVDEKLHLHSPGHARRVTHLAWAGKRGACMLYARWDDGEVVRLSSEAPEPEVIDLPWIDALASDDEGVLALLSSTPEPRVYVTDDGEHMSYRGLEVAEVPTAPVHLAVAGAAVAYAIGETGALLSRELSEPFARCEPLELAGPLAFEGAAPDSALFGAVLTPAFASLIRVDATGGALRVADMGSEEGPSLRGFTELAWDASRRKLWAISADVGLVVATAPSAKRGKLAAPS